MPTPQEVEQYLDKCRVLVDTSFVFLRSRNENKETRIELGYTYENIKNTIKELSVENYSEGPLQDHTYRAEVWIFGTIIQQREIYIKLQISKYNDPGDLTETLYCISFHFAKRSLNYPLNKNTGKE